MVPAMDREEPVILDIYKKIVAETKQRGQKAGIHCLKPEYARRMIDMGFSLVTLGNDSGTLLMAAKANVAATRAA